MPESSVNLLSMKVETSPKFWKVLCEIVEGSPVRGRQVKGGIQGFENGPGEMLPAPTSKVDSTKQTDYTHQLPLVPRRDLKIIYNFCYLKSY